MDAKETVQQGLDARKNVRAAEARAERYRELVDVTRDTLFREQMSHKRARSAWMEDKAILNGVINRQHDTIVRLREQMASAEDRAREARQTRAMIDGIVAAIAFIVLICCYDQGWIVLWLADSLTALSVFCIAAAIYTWLRNQ